MIYTEHNTISERKTARINQKNHFVCPFVCEKERIYLIRISFSLDLGFFYTFGDFFSRRFLSPCRFSNVRRLIFGSRRGRGSRRDDRNRRG